MKIKKNGKIINLTEKEIKKIINKHKINKFLNESIPPLAAKGGPHTIELDEEDKVSDISKKIRNMFIQEYGNNVEFEAGEKSDLSSSLSKALHILIKSIKKIGRDKNKQEAHKKVDE
jgi:hypothetical protein